MVKVIGDGKEYEFKEVKIKEIDTQIDSITKRVSFSYPYRTKKIETDMLIEVALIDKESKQEFVSVPKEIQFVYRYCELGLRVNKHTLVYVAYENESDWEFNISNEDERLNIDCVLVPTKREDLKAGDWAFWSFGDINYCSVELKELYRYVLILNGIKSVCISSVDDRISCCEEEIGDIPNWFKVVPKNGEFNE